MFTGNTFVHKRKTKMDRQLQGSSFFHIEELVSAEWQLAILEQKILVVSKACDQKGQILNLDVLLRNINFLLINFYNSNSESDKICTLFTLQKTT